MGMPFTRPNPVQAHKIEDLSWPKDYQLYVAGEMESRNDSFGSMPLKCSLISSS